MLTVKEKAKVMGKFQSHAKDTGSVEVRVGILAEEIKRLGAHLKQHPKDNHSRRGLLGMVAQRKKFLDYLRSHNPKRYAALAKKLGLKAKSQT